MVLEMIMDPENVKQSYLKLFALSFVYTIISIITSTFLFPGYESLFFVALITIIFVPFFQGLFALDEKYEDLAALKKLKLNLFMRHERTIKTFAVFFLGITIAIAASYVLFPNYGELFSIQNNILKSFMLGNAVAIFPNAEIGITANAVAGGDNFLRFLLNNTGVMLMVFVMSLFFGAGSILVLAWNASVMGSYIGLLIRALTDQGVNEAFAFIYGVPYGLASIALHGIPEIYAYFLAGLAGGILSVGLIKEKFGSVQFKKIFIDSIKFLLIAEVLIIFAAWIEVAFVIV